MSEFEVVKPDICPTCKQKIEKKVELGDLRKVVTVYKMATGYPKEDKGWDRAHFARTMRPAKVLLEFLGSWEKAADCIQDIYEKMTSIGMSCTMETIVKHSAEWKKDHQEKESKHGNVFGESDGNRETYRRPASGSSL